MSTSFAARHKMAPEVAALSLDEVADRYVGRFRDKTPDWAAFEDAKIEGYKRAQHRFIGAGGSGKHSDPSDFRVVTGNRMAKNVAKLKFWQMM